MADAAGRAPGGHPCDGNGRQRVRWQAVRRRLLNLVTVLSLMLCVAVCVLWVRSYWLSDELLVTWRSGRAFVETTSGGVGLVLSLGGDWSNETGLAHQVVPRKDSRQSLALLYSGSGPGSTIWEGWGAGYIYARFGPDRSIRELVLPSWVVCVASATPGAAFWITTDRRRRRTRARRGLCPACGYDMRATPDRCPECGDSVRKEG